MITLLLALAALNTPDFIKDEIEIYSNERNAIEVVRRGNMVTLVLFPNDSENGDCDNPRAFCPTLVLDASQMQRGQTVRDQDNKCTFEVREQRLNGMVDLRVDVNAYCARDFGREYSGYYVSEGPPERF